MLLFDVIAFLRCCYASIINPHMRPPVPGAELMIFFLLCGHSQQIVALEDGKAGRIICELEVSRIWDLQDCVGLPQSR